MRALLLLLMLASCSHVSINASSQATTGVPSTTPPRGGNSFSSSSAGLQVNAGGGAAAAIVAGVIIVSALREPAQPGSFRGWSDFSDWFWGRPAPEMTGDRRIAEQDCSKPIDLSSGNLRCR